MLEQRYLASDRHPTFVFVSQAGTLVSPNNVRRLWRQVRESCQLDWVTPHTLRRTVATLVNADYGSREAAAVLGHTSDRVTIEHYIQRSHDAPDVAMALDEAERLTRD